jgi:DNA phosphorothioation-associated putative methyltransferase
MTFAEYQQALEKLPYGKRLPTARYVFTSDDCPLPEPLAALIQVVRQKFAPGGPHNLIKFHTESFKVSLLHYPRFFEDPHPALEEAVVVDLVTGKAKKISYSKKNNPPILHRKETMLPPNHPKIALFARLSSAGEKHGLYQETSRIGFRQNWDNLLRDKGIAYRGHTLFETTPKESLPKSEQPITVHRHRTAMTCTELSKPVRELLHTGLFQNNMTLFDFGCGHGSDVRLLSEMGFKCSGWDPVHAPTAFREKASVVNLGFVLNVIENPAERVETLVEAWSLAESILVVSTLVEGQEGHYSFKRGLNDGIVTVRSTFQKYFAQAELQILLEETLHVDADALGLGIFIVFRDSQTRQAFLFSRIQRDLNSASVHRCILRPPSNRKPRPGFAEIYAEHRSLMDAFWLRFATLGRFPLPSEFDQLEELIQKVGKPAKAAKMLTDYFGDEVIEDARQQRTDDLVVYLAIAQFRRAISMKDMPESLQRDIKTFFGSHLDAQKQARELLYSAGQSGVIAEACRVQIFGWNTDDHFTIHQSLLDQLPPVLRVYVHCSSVIYGNPRDADLIKIHKHSGKVTLQFYKNFEGQMLPELKLRVKVDLRALRAQVFDHSEPPFRQIMPFKDRFLGAEHPGLAEIQKFSKKLRRLGLTPENTDNGLSPEMMAAVLRRFRQ